ncbi:MAG TPA: potassium-transporting ATPase subunit KdpC [Phycisphaerales bacterium]|jgi:K+-transporting ATPase ATPase C chain|nr:potassium-transporting ATPase subunit KdpC [Phycisphaerales bacterium]
MLSQLRPAIAVFALLTLITGVLYPLAITGIAQGAFRRQANGSIIERSGKPVGSSLLGQEFSDPKMFWGRLSATGPVPYTAFNADKGTGSSGSNLGPTNPALLDAVKARIDALKAADAAVSYTRSANQPIPVDLVTASASGLDPHISLAAAEYQVPRVAKGRQMTEDAVRAAVQRHTQNRQLGILGEPVVNVLELNLDLDTITR